jgi:membrane-associated phospholipid phosphatase
LRTRQELFAHARAAGLVGLAGFVCFILWPTAIPEGAGLTAADAAALAWLKQVDAAGNACPSLHVAFAAFAGVWLHRIFTEMRLPVVFKVLSITWVVAICYSTLATKQHVVIDVVAGAALGIVAGRVSTRVPGTSRVPDLQLE